MTIDRARAVLVVHSQELVATGMGNLKVRIWAKDLFA